MVETDRSELRASIAGFLRWGSSCWPGAHHFVILEVRWNGDLTGAAWEVCPSCVSEAAQAADARLRTGDSTLLDLVGETEPITERCHLCGDVL